MTEVGSSSPDQFPFTLLPPDVQYNVCQSLCHHCGNDEDPMSILYHDPAEHTGTLMNLCLTSRQTHSLAQLILYHFPRVYSYSDFFRTLHARPDLACSVKVQRWVHQDEQERSWNRRNHRELREDLWYLRSLAIELQLSDTGFVEFAKVYEDWPEGNEDDISGTFRYKFGIDFDNLVTAITMALCPRLEFLSVNLDDQFREDRDSTVTPATYRYLPGLAKQPSQGLLFVHTLVLQSTLHHDPNFLDVDRISFIWCLLPNVRRLIFFRGISEQHYLMDVLVPEDEPRPEYSWKALRKLKDLRFVRYSRCYNELPLPAIRRLVSKCKGLEKFTFSPYLLDNRYFDRVFSPLKVLQTVSSTSSTLRHLTINCPITEGCFVDPTQLLGSELKDFIHLESLVIDQAVFCHHHHDPISTRGRRDCLTNMLPESIRQLTVNIHAMFAPLVDLVALGEAVCHGEFPKLAFLRLQMTFEDAFWPDADPPASPPSYAVSIRKIPAPELNKPLLAPRKKLASKVLGAFEGSNVAIQVQYFRRRPAMGSSDWQLASPFAPLYCDAQLIEEDQA